ncbi:MAG: acyl-CoA thioesterase [Leptospira sp.]|nr:acyl-CoA thioesterase [Leptospira sp.]
MNESRLEPRPVAKSQVEMVELVLPNDANPLGNILGGRVMHLIDVCGAIAARRHCGNVVVTASMDRLTFYHPIKMGDVIILKASVNYAKGVSMEVGVKVFGESARTGKVIHTSSAFLTFVALDTKGKPTAVPDLKLETSKDQKRFSAAVHRRRLRKEYEAMVEKIEKDLDDQHT